MTRISEIRAEHEADTGGQWFHWRGTIHFKVRGHLSREYQREVRVARMDNPEPNGESTAADRITYEEVIGRAMVPHAARLILVDWWGIDDEVEPVKIETGANGIFKPTLVFELNGQGFFTLDREGKRYRPEGELWQQMVPFSAEAAAAYLSDPKCCDFLDAVRAAANEVDLRRIRRDVALLGKPSSTSSGKSPTASTPKS